MWPRFTPHAASDSAECDMSRIAWSDAWAITSDAAYALASGAVDAARYLVERGADVISVLDTEQRHSAKHQP